MRCLLIRIGNLLLALSASVVLWATPVLGAGSTSYQLQTNFPNDSILGGGTATNYALEDGSLTWEAKPLASATYQLLTGTADTNPVSSGGGTSGGTSGGDTGGGEPAQNRRPRVESSSSSSVSSSQSARSTSSASSQKSSDGTQSSVSASSASSVMHRAPDAEPVVTQGETSTLGPVTDIFSPDNVETITRITSPGAIRFFDVIDGQCTTIVHRAGNISISVQTRWLILLIALLILGGPALMDITRRYLFCANAEKRKKRRILHVLIALILTCAVMAGTTGRWIDVAHATQTTPNMHAYNGRLLDSSGSPITSATTIRFSYWKSTDYVSTDITGAGAIDTGATNYAGWQEVQTVTPNANGYFSVELGSVTSLPDFSTLPVATLLSLYLQVEVKPSASANTAYELLDVDSSDTAIDRAGILSVPFAKNADTIDQREIGTSSGSIAVLGPSGTFAKSVTSGGTNSGSFILDADNSESSAITLQFGTTLAKKLTYSITSGTFIFNDDVEVQGNLTVSGLINGIDLSSLGSSTDTLRTTSGGGLNALIAAGSYRLNSTVVNFAGSSIAMAPSVTNYVFFGSGGLTKNSTGFPSDESYIPLSEVTTSAGSITNIADRRIMNSDTRERTVTMKFNPAFEKVSFQADGTNNVGQLTLLHDDINLKNYYRWASTQTTLQDYDLLVHIPLSPSFVRWLQIGASNPVSFTYRTTSASALNNKIDIQIYDTSGVPVTLSGAVSDLTSTSWATSEIEFTGVPTWTAGQDMMVRIRGFSKDNFEAQISSLKLNYMTLGE